MKAFKKQLIHSTIFVTAPALPFAALIVTPHVQTALEGFYTMMWYLTN